MSTRAKSLPGKLFDAENKLFLADITVNLEFSPALNLADYPQCRATLTTKGVKADWSDKTYTLKLNDKILGVVLLSLADFNSTETWFKVFFHDAFWMSREWYAYLQELF